MTRPSFHFLGSAAVAAAQTAAATAGGVERFWRQADQVSGDFNDPNQWVDGDTLGIPGLLDTAAFDLPVLYTVHFPVAQLTDRVVVRRGNVTFDLASPYELLNPLPTTPGVVVGETGSDSARLTLSGGALMCTFARIGLGEGAFGWLVVSGAEAALLNGSNLSVGEQGAGVMEIEGAATVFNGPAAIAAGIGAFGDVTVAGPLSTWFTAGSLVVGKGGAGGLTIDDGAIVISGAAMIAQNDSSFGDVVVRGPASSWLVFGSLDIGMTGPGTLIIEDGGYVLTEDFATIGTFPQDFPFGEFGGIGDVRILAAGSLWAVEGDLHVGYLSAGRWTLGQGGRVTVGGDLFRGDWLPNDPLPQSVIELGAASDYPVPAIEVAGVTDGFDVRIDLVGGFEPAAGDLFEIATAASGASSFTFDLPALPPPLVWLELGDDTAVRLRVGPIVGDLDGDGFTGITDLLAMLASWGPCKGCPADLDGDGDVGISDLLLLLANWD